MMGNTTQPSTLFSTVKPPHNSSKHYVHLLLHRNSKDKLAKKLDMAYGRLVCKQWRIENKPGGHEGLCANKGGLTTSLAATSLQLDHSIAEKKRKYDFRVRTSIFFSSKFN